MDRLDSRVRVRGFWVEPAEIVAALANHPLVRQAEVRAVEAHVHGDSLRAQVSAIVVPDFEALRTVASVDAADAADVRRLLQAELGRIARAAALGPHEIPADFLLEDEAFDDQNGFLTQSGKLARQRIRLSYRARLEALDARQPTAQLGAPSGVPPGVAVRQIIRPFLRSTWHSRELPDDLPLAQAFDSMALLETLLACETHFGVALPIEDLRRAPDVEPTLARLVEWIGEASRRPVASSPCPTTAQRAGPASRAR